MSNPATTGLRPHALGALATVAIAGLWWALATHHPTSTYHFTPAIAVLAWAFTLTSLGVPVGGMDILLSTVGAVTLTSAMTLVLAATDSLRGPTLIDRGSALAESLIFVAVAATGSAAWLLQKRTTLTHH